MMGFIDRVFKSYHHDITMPCIYRINTKGYVTNGVYSIKLEASEIPVGKHTSTQNSILRTKSIFRIL